MRCCYKRILRCLGRRPSWTRLKQQFRATGELMGVLRACSLFWCRQLPEQPTDRFMNDPGCHLILERDGAVQSAGERGDDGRLR